MAIWDTVALRVKQDITKQKWRKLKKERVCNLLFQIALKIIILKKVPKKIIDILYQKGGKYELS